MDNNVKEETSITDDDSEADSYESFLRESDNEQASACDEDTEVPLTEEEVEELVYEFLEVESKAAEAQESLEKESLDKIETEVRLELSERLQGDELESAVSTEMEQFQLQWENVLDDLETRSSVLLEQLDAAGIELPRLYKSIESQVPNVCETEAWKSRAHWAGFQVPEEANLSIRKADEYLQSCRPVRRKHGRMLEEGASGFLAGKLPVGDADSVEYKENSWSSFNEFIKSKEIAENTFGSSNWASVYLASTPQEAAALGLQFPGVNEVEEISEVDGIFGDIKGVDEVELSEEQRRRYRKVKEEDDAKIMNCLQRRLKGKRTRGTKENFGLDSSCHEVAKSDLPSFKKLKTDETLEHTCEDDEELFQRRSETVIIESDDELQIDSKPTLQNDGEGSSARVEKVVDIIDLDLFPSQSPKLSAKTLPKDFKCTICTEMLNASDVHRHPVLDVTVCGPCRFLVIEKNRLEGPVSGGYCTWCVQNILLQSCSSCKLLFCKYCLSKNLGEECLSEAKATGWQCCCCVPSQLEILISECDKALSGVESSDSDSSNLDLSGLETSGPVSKQRMKKKIRRIIDDTELGEETKRKIAMEKARQDHLKSMQEQSASKLKSENVGTSFGAPLDVSDAGDGHIVNLAREEDEEPVRIPSSMSSKLKPHQVEGIRFMWENAIQSVKKVKSGDKGLGCILAHNMGLGKTFQVITFLYTVMKCAQLGLRTALIVTPVNVLHNWRKEFSKWCPAELKPLRVFMLEDVARLKRPDLLTKWRAKGGVLLIGYSSFRNLSLGKHVKDKNVANEIAYALQMVDFVREGFLGSSHEFRNRFQNPIENGQHTNSTSDDVWNHPGLLQMAREQRGNLRREDGVENFMMDESSSDDNTENYLPNGEKKDRPDQQSKKCNFLNEENNWWEELLDDNTYMEADYSGKMILLLDILSKSSELGDKVLVFSQSLTTLDLVEFYLSKLQIKGKEGKYWKQGKDWYRWIAGYHEHEALLQENDEDRLTKEEQDMALSEWEALRRAGRDPYRKSNMTAVPTDPNLVRPVKAASRSRQPQQPKVNSNNQKKCNNLAHLLTLRSHGTKAGCTTTCNECGQEISWETLNRDGGRSR
nr:unnamed protein product [Digitaria exilis]